jgi:hypothetical protein
VVRDAGKRDYRRSSSDENVVSRSTLQNLLADSDSRISDTCIKEVNETSMIIPNRMTFVFVVGEKRHSQHGISTNAIIVVM